LVTAPPVETAGLLEAELEAVPVFDGAAEELAGELADDEGAAVLELALCPWLEADAAEDDGAAELAEEEVLPVPWNAATPLASDASICPDRVLAMV